MAFSMTGLQTPMMPRQQQPVAPSVPMSLGGGPSLPTLGQSAASPSEQQSGWRAFIDRLGTDNDLQRAFTAAAAAMTAPGEGSDLSRVVQGAAVGFDTMGTLQAERRAEGREDRQLGQGDRRLDQGDRTADQQDRSLDLTEARDAEAARRNVSLEELQAAGLSDTQRRTDLLERREDSRREVDLSNIDRLSALADLAEAQADDIRNPAVRATKGGLHTLAEAVTAARVAANPSLDRDQVFIQEVERLNRPKAARKPVAEFAFEVMSDFEILKSTASSSERARLDNAMRKIISSYENFVTNDVNTAVGAPQISNPGLSSQLFPPPQNGGGLPPPQAAPLPASPAGQQPMGGQTGLDGTPIIYVHSQQGPVTQGMLQRMATMGNMTLQQAMQAMVESDPASQMTVGP